MAHRFQFFRAGGVDQVSLADGADMLALGELDQKLWVALAMPTKGVAIDPDTLALLDGDADGRIRAPDILAAVGWAKATFKQPNDLPRSACSRISARRTTRRSASPTRSRSPKHSPTRC